MASPLGPIPLHQGRSTPAPLTLFDCVKRSMRLSTSGCAKLYVAANAPRPLDPWLGAAACRACPVGCANATGRAMNPIDGFANALRSLCGRCGRPTPELINGTFCRSCHARHLEGIARKNAKGHVPAISHALHTERLAVALLGRAPHMHTRHAVVSLAEVIIQHARTARSQASYGRRGVAWDAETHSRRLGWSRQSEMAL